MSDLIAGEPHFGNDTNKANDKQIRIVLAILCIEPN